MRYACLGLQIVNDVHFADGSERKSIMGGTVFALGGILQYCNDAVLFANRGCDWETYYGAWFSSNAIRTDGLVPMPEKQTFSELVYKPTGEWNETMHFGAKDAAGENLRMLNMLFDAVTDETRGVYLFDSIYNAPFWDIVRKRTASGPRPKIMLELLTKECVHENLAHFRDEILPLIDIYSLNKAEALPFFHVETEQEAIEQIIRLGKPCYFRCGKRGAYMVMDGKAVFAPSMTVRAPEDEIDPTGCGNCSTAAALYGYAEGYNAAQIGCMASLAAGYNVMQYGPTSVFTAQTREESLARALRESKNLKQ